MKTFVTIVIAVLGFLSTVCFVYAESLYEETKEFCTDATERVVVITADSKTDISVYREDGSLNWSRQTYEDLVAKHKILFVIRCTSDESPIGAIPVVFMEGRPDDLKRVIEMEYTANSVAQERGRYTYVFHGIANFSKELFVVFGLRSDVKADLLRQYNEIPKDERALERLPFQNTSDIERELIVYPEQVSDTFDRIYFQYKNYIQEYYIETCQTIPPDNKIKPCDLMSAYDFAIKLLKSGAAYFVYVQVYKENDIPLMLHLPPS